MKLSRRQALASLVTASAGQIPLAAIGFADTAPPSAANGPDGVCVLWPQMVEGPYYFDPKLVRQDIAEGRPGAPVKLVLKIVEFGSCKPLANVRIDVWHADADGIYSGYNGQGDHRDTSTKGQSYLRGTQMAGLDGSVMFSTIFPGWYPGRTPHIHIKAMLDDKTIVTGQAFFPDAFSERIYRGATPYSTRPVPDTTNATDGIYQNGEKDGGGIVLALAEEGSVIVAALTIAVDRIGGAARKSQSWGDRLREVFGRR